MILKCYVKMNRMELAQMISKYDIKVLCINAYNGVSINDISYK